MRLGKISLVTGLLASCGLFAQNLLTNPSFEEVTPDGKAVGWGVKAPVYTLSEEFARTGKKSLHYKNDDENRYELCGMSITDKIDRNTFYKFGVYAKMSNVKGDGPTVCVEFWKGKDYLGGIYPPGLKSTNSEWELAEGIIRSIPENATSINMTVYCRQKTTGDVWFDDAFLEPYVMPLFSVHTTDAYHNIIDGHRDLNVYAMVFIKKCKPEDVPGLKLTVFDKAGKAVSTSKPNPHDATGVRFTVPTRNMAPGEYTYRIEATVNGKHEQVEGTFKRVAEYPQRKAYIDDYRRLIVDGKPFFPLGLYFSGITDDYKIFRDSPFNCIMPYNPISRKDLDMLHQDGKSVIYSVKDLYPGHRGLKTQEEADAATVKTINDLKDHPAIIAWYANDEMPLAMLKQLKAKRDLVEKTDEGRPSWVVLYQYQEIREYLPSYDVIGTDPYPINTISNPGRALDWARLTTEGAFGTRANWMVPQVFNWSAYWTKYGKPVDEILKCRAPSFEEMKSMTWMCISGGATGLIYYSWFDLIRMAKERDYKGIKLPADDFDKRWGEIKKMAAEVKEHEDVLLSIDPALDIKAINKPIEIGMRLFGKGDETWVLLVNSEKEKVVSCTLSAPCNVVCRGTTLSEAKPAINGSNVQITLKPLEAVFMRLARK